VDSYHGLCGWILGNFGLHAVFVGGGRSADLLAVRIVSGFLGLHLAEFATKEITASPRRRKRLSRPGMRGVAAIQGESPPLPLLQIDSITLAMLRAELISRRNCHRETVKQ
jgi:hypothetical protein